MVLSTTTESEIIDHYTAITQRFFDEDDNFAFLETVTQISLLNQLSFILEHYERLYEEVTNDPFDANRANFLIQKLLDNTREDLVEVVFNQILMNSQAEENLLLAGMRFLIATAPLLDPSTYMNEDLLDRLMNMIHSNSELNKDNIISKGGGGGGGGGGGAIYESTKMITYEGLAKRTFSCGLLSIATMDNDVSNYVITHDMTLPLLYRLKYYIHHRPRRPKYDAFEKPKAPLNADTDNEENNNVTTTNLTSSEQIGENASVNDVMSDGNEANGAASLNEEQLKYMEMRMVLRVFQNLGDYMEVLGPVIQEGGMDLINPLLCVKDKFVLTDSLKLCSVLLTHQKFAELFVDKGGLKQILKLPKIPYLIGGVGLCIRDIGQLSSVMDRLCKSTPYMERMVEHGLLLLGSSVNELKKIGSIFFYAVFSYKPVIAIFDKSEGLRTLVNIFRMPISFPEDATSGKNLSHCACLALRSYFRMHLLLSGFQMMPKKTKKKGSLKYMELHKIAGNRTITDMFARNMNSLVSYLQRTQWKPASDFMQYGGINLILELISVSSYWNAAHVAHCALEVLQLITIAPFTHLPICDENLDSGRKGLGLILETAAATSNNEAYIMVAALEVIVNIVCLPEPPSIIPPMILQAKRRICELLRTNDGLGVLLDILRYAIPTNADTVRALACKALLGLSQDATINQIIRKMDVSEIISDLLKENKDKQQVEEFQKFQEYALSLLSKTTGREPKTISMEARDHTLVRLEKAAIVANTHITYSDTELMRVIHGYLKNKGMNQTASTLLEEAKIEPFADKENAIMSSTTEVPRLDKIVTQYFRHQHRECEDPISVLPPFSLFTPHKCPAPHHFADASTNLVSRLLSKQMQFGRGLHNYNMRKMDRQFTYSRFRHVKTFKDEESPFLTCATFEKNGEGLFCGTEYGEIFEYDIETQERVNSYQIGELVDGLRLSKNGQSMLAWLGSSTKLFSTDKFSHHVHEFQGCNYAEWSNGNDLIVGTGLRSTMIYDALTGDQIANLVDPKLENDWTFNIACFNPYDDLILSDAVLWDYRAPHQIIRRFDRLSSQGLGVFHPSGNEVIINSEIWDVRTFKLLSTCPALGQTQSIQFSPNNDVIFAIYRPDQKSDNRSTLDRSHFFRTIDAKTFETIASIDADRAITDIAVDPKNNYLACIVDEVANSQTSCRLFEMGRARRGDEDEEHEDEEEEEEEEEEEDELVHLGEGSDADEMTDDEFADFFDGVDADEDFDIDGDLLAALLRGAEDEGDEDEEDEDEDLDDEEEDDEE